MDNIFNNIFSPVMVAIPAAFLGALIQNKMQFFGKLRIDSTLIISHELLPLIINFLCHAMGFHLVFII
ncbi:MAG: hypothetical protein FWF92_08235 [Oscillospiraceae bacterium]|nr:hypothetical protein [Oscillospiraceae bacterium]